MAEFLKYNANPFKLRTGDCVFRALSVFLGVPWRIALDDLVCWAADRGLTNFNYRSTDRAYLEEKGFPRYKSPRKGISVGEFCDEFAEPGKIYIVQCPRHWTVVKWNEYVGSAIVIDTWDCRGNIMEGYWVRNLSTTQHEPLL